MKPELAVLPLEVWADVFESPLISRQKLAQIANGIGNRKFTEKLQKLLHECGKYSLHFLQISNTSKCQSRKRKISEFPAALGVAYGNQFVGSVWVGPDYKNCEFPECEMPENIKSFKRLEIRHVDAKTLDFLDKIKSLFTNVFLDIDYSPSLTSSNVRIFAHFLPMLASIRAIKCINDDSVNLLERHFPGTLARAKELDVFIGAESNPISAYLSWLNAPLDFGVNGPRFLVICAAIKSISAIVEAVRKQFLAATTPSTFVAILEFGWSYIETEMQLRPDQCKTEVNSVTNEQLTIKDAIFKIPGVEHRSEFHYVEIMRHPKGAEAKMREWIEQRAYYEKKFSCQDKADPNGVVCLAQPTIGHINITNKKEAKALDQDGNESNGEEKTGPSTSAN